MRSAGGGGLVFYQYGDFAAAADRFAAGEEETYYDQRRSVGHVVAMADKRRVTVVSLADGAPYDAEREGVRCIGLSGDAFRAGEGASVVAHLAPDALILRTPHLPVLAVARAQNVPTFCCLADIFDTVPLSAMFGRKGLGKRLLNRRLARAFAAPHVTALGNHGLSASRSLRDVLGLEADRIIPWEWTALEAAGPLRPVRRDGPLRLVYAGAISREKGIGDLLEAVATLTRGDVGVALGIFGDGAERPGFAEKSKALGIAEIVRFHGRCPNTEVRRAMERADAVIVPSHHSYPEGLPNVIFEALAARAPLVISDHPAFADRFRPQETAIVVPAEAPHRLAEELMRLARDPALGAALSERAEAMLSTLYVGVSWYDAIDCFAADPVNDTGWVAPRSLARLNAAD